MANPSNTFATAMAVVAKTQLGDAAGANEWTQKLLKASSMAGSSEWMPLAWTSVNAGKPNAELIDKLKGAGGHDLGVNYTLAALQAALHQPDEAMQSLRAGIDKQDYAYLATQAWLAYGAICAERLREGSSGGAGEGKGCSD